MVSQDDSDTIIHIFVSSQLDYCNSLFTSLNKKELAHSQYEHNSAERFRTCINSRAHVTPVLKTLHWPPVAFTVNFNILFMTFRALYGHAPKYNS